MYAIREGTWVTHRKEMESGSFSRESELLIWAVKKWGLARGKAPGRGNSTCDVVCSGTAKISTCLEQRNNSSARVMNPAHAGPCSSIKDMDLSPKAREQLWKSWAQGCVMIRFAFLKGHCDYCVETGL